MHLGGRPGMHAPFVVTLTQGGVSLPKGVVTLMQGGVTLLKGGWPPAFTTLV